MKPSCDIVRDLMPLYVEGIASDASRRLIEEHTDVCEECKAELQGMNAPAPVPMDFNTGPLKKIRSALQKEKWLAILFSTLLTVSVCILVIGYLTAPSYLPDAKNAAVSQKADGTVLVTFGSGATGYEVSQYLTEDGSGYVYHLTAWDSVWSRFIVKADRPSLILNPNGETVASVYYYTADGSHTEDTLLFGKEQASGGGVVTLPRLVLGAYALLAAGFALLCLLVRLLFWRSKKIRRIMAICLPLPLAYLLSHLCLKGFSAATYSPVHDFFAILLFALPIYGALLLGVHLLRKRHASSQK